MKPEKLLASITGWKHITSGPAIMHAGQHHCFNVNGHNNLTLCDADMLSLLRKLCAYPATIHPGMDYVLKGGIIVHCTQRTNDSTTMSGISWRGTAIQVPTNRSRELKPGNLVYFLAEDVKELHIPKHKVIIQRQVVHSSKPKKQIVKHSDGSLNTDDRRS